MKNDILIIMTGMIFSIATVSYLGNIYANLLAVIA
jgi:hypothetical protein